MQSRTKQPLTRQEIQAAVDDCFGGPQEIESIHELADGWYNAAYAISLPRAGIETVLRAAPHPSTRLLAYEKDLMWREVRTYELLSERGNVPVPQLYGYNFRRNILPRDFMFIEKMQGQPLNKVKESLTQVERDAISVELGEMARRIHRIEGESFGYFSGFPGGTPAPANQTWKTAFLHMVDTLLEDGEALKAALPVDYETVRREYHDRGDLFEAIHIPHLVHWDLWDPNVFVQQRKGAWHIEALTDCDRAFWGDPEAEYIFAFMGPEHPFFQGYGKGVDESPDAKERRRLYYMYLLLVMNIEAVTRFEGERHVTWAYEELKRLLP